MADTILYDNAYAKINLTLDIIGILPNGYHELHSVMQTLSLCDKVTVSTSERNSGITVKCSDPGVPTDEKNTCFKAAVRFFEFAGISDYGVEIVIDKKIPSMAGLGGGSSDAAAVLRLLNRLYSTCYSPQTLTEIARDVGADVPFLVCGGCALCLGFGERIIPIDSHNEFSVLLVKPDFGISTPRAYKLFDEKKIVSTNKSEALKKALENDAASDMAALLSNDLERAVECEQIDIIKYDILQRGALAAQMTGSGSCVFGLFYSKDAAIRAYNCLKDKYSFACVCETI